MKHNHQLLKLPGQLGVHCSFSICLFFCRRESKMFRSMMLCPKCCLNRIKPLNKFCFSVVNMKKFCAAYTGYLPRLTMELIGGQCFIMWRALRVDGIDNLPHKFLSFPFYMNCYFAFLLLLFVEFDSSWTYSAKQQDSHLKQHQKMTQLPMTSNAFPFFVNQHVKQFQQADTSMLCLQRNTQA